MLFTTINDQYHTDRNAARSHKTNCMYQSLAIKFIAAILKHLSPLNHSAIIAMVTAISLQTHNGLNENNGTTKCSNDFVMYRMWMQISSVVDKENRE